MTQSAMLIPGGERQRRHVVLSENFIPSGFAPRGKVIASSNLMP